MFSKAQRLSKPFQFLVLNMPGLNFIFVIYMTYFFSIEIVGVILFCRNTIHIISKITNSGFFRSNILRFSEKTEQKFIISTIKRILPLQIGLMLLVSLIFLNLINFLLPENGNLSKDTLYLIIIWMVLRIYGNYLTSFMVALKYSKFVAFFSQNFTLLFVMGTTLFVNNQSLNSIIICFIISTIIVALLALLNLYKQDLINQKDSTNIKSDIDLALKNLGFTLSDELIFFSIYYFVLFSVEPNLFYIFNIAFTFFNSSGSLKFLATNFYLPRIRSSMVEGSEKDTKKLLREIIIFYFLVATLASFLFYMLIDFIFISKPELIDYTNSISIFFISGLIFNTSFIYKNIYSLSNLRGILKLNLVYAALGVSSQVFLFFLGLQTMTSISLATMLLMLVYAINVSYLFKNLEVNQNQ